MIIFGAAIASDALDIEAGAGGQAEMAVIELGEVAVDAVLNDVAGGIDLDGFDDVEGAVGFHLDTAVEAEDVFILGGVADGGGQ